MCHLLKRASLGSSWPNLILPSGHSEVLPMTDSNAVMLHTMISFIFRYSVGKIVVDALPGAPLFTVL